LAQDRLYITTPIYYVNDKPHIGHLYCTVLADALARYARFMGKGTYFLTGTDEHGQKVQDAAEKRNLTPQVHVDEMHRAFRSLWPEFNIGHDDFIRTTEDRHKAVVREFLSRLYEAGEIYAKDYEGWYSVRVERFFTEKDLVDGKCPESGGPVEFVRERNYFFRMSKYSDRLRAHIEANEDFLRPAMRRNEILGFLDKGLNDLCISRPKSRLSWGIELPFDTDYVTYVWFDALSNYVSAMGYLDDPEKFKTWWPASHHLIGKDILTTHSVYWTTMLMALGIPLPKTITAHGWWLSDERKMGKSSGNAISPIEMKDVYGPDVMRYVLLREMVIGLDATFGEEIIVRRNNSDLSNDLGNLARRAAGLVSKYFDGKVPDPGENTEAEDVVAEAAKDVASRIPALVDDLKIHSAIEETLQFVRRLNKYITDTAPFKTAKTDPQAAARALYAALEGLRWTAWLLSPVMPEKAVELLHGIGADESIGTIDQLTWGVLPVGRPLNMEKGLFPRHDMPKREENAAPAEKKAAKKASKKKPVIEEPPSVIDFQAFMNVDLRVGLVLSAERVEGSDRLLKLMVDIGSEQRQIMAGIAEHYTPEQLVGDHVVVVANLAPRKIFKQESQGMVLAADTPEGGVAVVRPAGKVAPGTRVR
jgi:methionyl-tRNA synthetase